MHMRALITKQALNNPSHNFVCVTKQPVVVKTPQTTGHGTSHEDLSKNSLRLLILCSPLIKILAITLPAGVHKNVIPILISIAVRSFTFTGSVQYRV